ncbi:PH and SEC7 domain-containing protein 3 [Chionoecetes opilio]|uniref:PH and SEC7 domain-containing protein 3 n=1 Tax=Chionoecetes opilio TaxID=41210 RepID=A0A8J4XNH1_CHIOP|nr:PH and SEC7 domain-containing protein 3 [Chionoecetes opilio]
MAAKVKHVKLKRSETCGFGFSILGGAGSELPPIVYDIIEGSPAANCSQLAPGDIIWEVNGQEVVSFTTKEVLNCLRLSSSEVTLKLKTDAAVQEPTTYREFRHIKAKKSASRTPPEQSSTPPSLPSPTLSDASDRTSISHGSNHTASENGFHLRDPTAAENERNASRKPKSEAYLMTGDLILNLSRTSHDASWLPTQKTVDDLRKSGSSSVPTSPNEINVCGGRLVKRDLGSPQSLCSPVSVDNPASSGAVKFTYPPAGSSVRISKSEDQLQYQKDSNMCAVNIELEDDVTSSLNTLLDTCDDPRSSPLPPPLEDRIIWTFNAPRTTSPDSVRSSHDSDSPLIRSPSPLSPQSPTSSMQYSCSGVYDKMVSGRDSMGSSNRARRQDENRIVIKVEGPDAAPSGRRRPQHLQKSADDPFPPRDDVLRDPDLTPTNTRPPTPGSGTLSPDTLAYQELRESEDEITCLSEEDGTGKASSVRTSSTTSPPLSEDESDIESLHSFHYSPKAVDIPSAVRLAKRLIALDGFKKSDVSRHLSKNNIQGPPVATLRANHHGPPVATLRANHHGPPVATFRANHHGLPVATLRPSSSNIQGQPSWPSSSNIQGQPSWPSSSNSAPVHIRANHHGPPVATFRANHHGPPVATFRANHHGPPVATFRANHHGPPVATFRANHHGPPVATFRANHHGPPVATFRANHHGPPVATFRANHHGPPVATFRANHHGPPVATFRANHHGPPVATLRANHHGPPVATFRANHHGPPVATFRANHHGPPVATLRANHHGPPVATFRANHHGPPVATFRANHHGPPVATIMALHNEFSRTVAEEYLRYFDFRGDTLDKSLRKFLDRFCLAGETQERERVLVHFSHRFLESNPGTFNSQDAVHTLTCALMLLNTDLHGQNVGRKMTCNEFIDNLADLNDGENFPREVLKALYHAMRNQPLQWAVDTEGDGDVTSGSKSGGEAEVGVGSNPFLTPPSGNGVQYKKGYIMRKCCTDPNGKRTAFGKRSWKMWFCVIQDLVLYLHKDEQGARRGPQHAQLGHNAVRLHHSLATRAHDYSKKEHVFRLQTADQAEYLLQTSDSKELQAWIDTINLVAASLSAAPLPGAVGSQRKFQRPLLPCSVTKFNMSEQLEDHTKRLAQLEQELEDHKAHPPEKNSRAHSMSNYKEKEAHLITELKRYRTYVYLLRSKLTTQSPGQQQGGAAGEGELPVFEVHPPCEEEPEGGEQRGGGARVVPPPIPDRVRPSDSATRAASVAPAATLDAEVLPGRVSCPQFYGVLWKHLINSYEDWMTRVQVRPCILKVKMEAYPKQLVASVLISVALAFEPVVGEDPLPRDTGDLGVKVQYCDTRVTTVTFPSPDEPEEVKETATDVALDENKASSTTKNMQEKPRQDEDSDSNQGTLKSKNKQEREKRRLERETEKFRREMEKKEKEVEKKDKNQKEKDAKEQEKQHKINTQKQKKEEKKDDEAGKVKNGGDLTEQQKPEDTMHTENVEANREDNPGEARLGTLNRLSALFKFSKLNRKSYLCEEEEDQEHGASASKPPKPPPLPPKPDPQSPIMKNVGTRIDI